MTTTTNVCYSLDLSVIASLDNVFSLTNNDYKDLLNNLPICVSADALLQLTDGNHLAIEDEFPEPPAKRRVQAIEDKKKSKEKASRRSLPAVLRIADDNMEMRLDEQPVKVQLLGFDNIFYVCFDRFSHQSGQRRAFVYCPLRHSYCTKCRKYR